MKNTIYFNAEFAPLLLVNEEQVGSNSIVINIEADSTANQSLLITMDSGTTTSLTVTPGQENSLAIDEAYWSLGGSTFVSLVKGGLTSNSITLIFPETINTDAALEETSNLTYTMTGSNTVTEQIDNLDGRVTTLEQGGGGNVVYTSVANPDSTLGNEGDLWVRYHNEYDDVFINSDNEEVRVNLPRYESDDDAVSYVSSTFGPFFRSFVTVAGGKVNKTMKTMQGQITAAIYQLLTGSGAGYEYRNSTISQFPQLEPDVYTVNGQNVTVSTNAEGAGWGYMIDTRTFGTDSQRIRVNADDYNDVFEYPNFGLPWDYWGWYVYYNTTSRLIKVVGVSGQINQQYGTASFNIRNIGDSVSVDLVDTSFAVIDEVYCKINNKWTLYEGSGEGGTNVEVTQILTSGTEIAQIDLNGEVVSIYAPTPQTISYVQTLASGTNIGTITIDGTATPIYAPTSQNVSVTQTLASGTEIGSITVDNTTTTLYAPTGGGSDVTVTPKTSTGTNIADISVDGTTYQLFAPSGGGSEIERWIDWDNKVDITLPYTATADGYFFFRIYQAKCQVTINGVNIISQAESDREVSGSGIYPISTGDVLKLDFGTAPGTMWFVPLKETGTGSSGHNYSTDEQIIGTWIDGKPIYEITYELATPLTINSTSYIHSGITPANIKSLIGMPDIIDVHGQSAPIAAGLYSNGEIALAALNTVYGIDLKYLIVRYTKTTD